MKHGLLYSESKSGLHKNIGDHVQSIAADQFMHSSLRVEREHLDVYTGEPIKLVMNGWFMHYPDRFPPSEAINPLFISFHLRPKVAKKFLTEEAVAYLKAHAPIGCRDKRTLKMLKARGIDAYFSSCLTLTLDRTFARAPEAERQGVCFVDPLQIFSNREVAFGLLRIVRHPLMTLRIFSKLRVQALKGERLRTKVWSFLAIGAFFKAYRALFSDELLLSAEYYTHMVMDKLFDSLDAQFDYARKLVDRYAHAKYCVTTRIHCALPCVAIGVPVIFVEPERKNVGKGRFDGILGYFSVAKLVGGRLKPQFKLSGGKRPRKLTADAPVPARKAHLKVARALAERCEAFAAE